MVCRRITRNPNKICLGDLNKKIKIQTTGFVDTNAPNTDSSLQFITILEPWAMIKTFRNVSEVKGVNTANSITHDFYIRSTSVNLDEEIFVEFDNKKFKIDTVENIDEEDKFVRLSSIERGI